MYGSDYSYAGELIGFLLIFYVILLLVIGVIGVLTTIINWKILKKMGNEGWKALIPIYNVWSICEGIGVNPHWSWIIVVSSIVCSYIPRVGSLLSYTILIYFFVVYYVSLAKAFNKEGSYAVLLYFFFPIVGFFLVKEDYVGKRPFHDIVMEDWLKIKNPAYDGNEAKTTQEAQVNQETHEAPGAEVNQEVPEANVSVEENVPTENAEGGEICSNCGSPLDANSKFCTSCGKERN